LNGSVLTNEARKTREVSRLARVQLVFSAPNTLYCRRRASLVLGRRKAAKRMARYRGLRAEK
jgi:hypothetical protein